jgi:hypothetical protein
LDLSRLVVSGVKKKMLLRYAVLVFKAKKQEPLLGDSAATSALGDQSTNYPLMPTMIVTRLEQGWPGVKLA